MQNSQQISLREAPIPKEAPWKTLVLNEQFRKKRGCEFSTITSGTERKRGFVGIYPSQSGNSVKVYKNSSTIPVFLIDN